MGPRRCSTFRANIWLKTDPKNFNSCELNCEEPGAANWHRFLLQLPVLSSYWLVRTKMKMRAASSHSHVRILYLFVCLRSPKAILVLVPCARLEYGALVEFPYEVQWATSLFCFGPEPESRAWVLDDDTMAVFKLNSVILEFCINWQDNWSMGCILRDNFFLLKLNGQKKHSCKVTNGNNWFEMTWE